MGLYSEKASTIKQEGEKDFSNPKEFLKMLTRQESDRKHKAMLIDDGQEEDRADESSLQKSSMESPMRSSKISYFQKTSPKDRSKEVKGEDSRRKDPPPVDSGSQEIKKLLESLIANKAEFEERKNKF